MATWTEEQKKEIVDKYLARNPTPSNSVQIVEEIAEDLGLPKNSVRMALSNAKVYIKKTDAAVLDIQTSDKPARKSKQSSLDELAGAISKAGQEVDEAIVSKLTGKAAEYFVKVITGITR